MLTSFAFFHYNFSDEETLRINDPTLIIHELNALGTWQAVTPIPISSDGDLKHLGVLHSMMPNLLPLKTLLQVTVQ